MTLNQAVLFMRIEASETRLSMCSSALLSSVMYHINIMTTMPQSAQDSSRADFFMALCYAVNILIWMTALSQYMCVASTRPILSRWAKESYFHKTRATVPFVSIVMACWIMIEGSQWLNNILLILGAFAAVVLFLALDYKRFVATLEDADLLEERTSPAASSPNRTVLKPPTTRKSSGEVAFG